MVGKKALLAYVKETPNYMSIFMFSFYFMAISPILVEISESIHLAPGDVSLVFTFYTIGMIAGQLSSMFFIKKIKRIFLIVITYSMLITVTAAIIFVNNILFFFSIYLFSGYLLGIIWIMGNINVLASKVENKNRITLITLSFYPMGAFTAPLISSWLTRNDFGWQSIYYVAIALLFITLMMFVFIKGKDYLYKEKGQTSDKSHTGIFGSKAKSIFFGYLVLAIFTYSIAEIVVVTWLPTFFRITYEFDVGTAGFFVSIYWVAVFVGRMLGSTWLLKIKAKKIMVVASIIATVSIFLLVNISLSTFIIVLSGIAGIASSSIFPLLISTCSTVFKEQKSQATTLLFAASNVGVAAAPYLTRTVSQYSMAVSASLSFIFMFITFILLVLIFVYDNRKKLIERQE